MKAGKVWGETRQLFHACNVEIHRIEVHPGGYCSRHCHRGKFNMFCLESGDLAVEVWKNDYELVDVTHLEPGQTTTVPPGEFHRFTSCRGAVAYEVYWTEIESGDIERTDCGGVRECS